jgi:hypothetical protein
VLFDKALEGFLKSGYHKREVSRTLFLKSKFFRSTNDHTKADELEQSAGVLYREICPGYPLSLKPVMQDFDNIVAFWSR